MNPRKTLLITSALIAAASALGARAADTSFSVEQQMAEGEGYYSQYPVQSKPEPVKPKTALQVQRDQEVLRQMTMGDGYDPLYAATPPQRPMLPETARQLKADRDFARQMAKGEGYVPQDPVHSTGSGPVAITQVTEPQSSEGGN